MPVAVFSVPVQGYYLLCHGVEDEHVQILYEGFIAVVSGACRGVQTYAEAVSGNFSETVLIPCAGCRRAEDGEKCEYVENSFHG